MPTGDLCWDFKEFLCVCLCVIVCVEFYLCVCVCVSVLCFYVCGCVWLCVCISVSMCATVIFIHTHTQHCMRHTHIHRALHASQRTLNYKIIINYIRPMSSLNLNSALSSKTYPKTEFDFEMELYPYLIKIGPTSPPTPPPRTFNSVWSDTGYMVILQCNCDTRVHIIAIYPVIPLHCVVTQWVN